MEKNNPLVEKYGSDKRWVNYRIEERNGKKTKVPYSPVTGRSASSTKSSDWTTFEAAKFIHDDVGIVFTPEKNLLGIDIDHCLINNKIDHAQKESIQKLVQEANTYVEISPSGSGLHLFLALNEKVDLEANRKSPFEIYTSGRYFTFTGKVFGSHREVRSVGRNEALQLLSVIGYPWKRKEASEELGKDKSGQQNGEVLTDDAALLDLIFKSKSGKKIEALYGGDISAYNNDDSVADMAFLAHLSFWTQKNYEQMDRIWMASPLGSRKKTSTRKDYRHRSITNSISACRETYTPLKNKAAQQEIKEDDELIFNRSSDIVSKPIEWLWPGKIAKGKVTLVAGDPGLGKSQVTLFLAGVVSNGGLFPGGSKCMQGDVLLFSAEDDAEDTINPRLTAVQADKNRVSIFNVVKKGGKDKFFDLSSDIALLEKKLIQEKNVSLIVIDPITAFLGDTDSHVNAEVRALLSILSKLASKYHIAIVVVTHLNKSTGGSPLSKITGSLAFVAAARAAFMVIKDENDEQRRLFLTVKNNIADDKGGFAFRVEGLDVSKDPSNPIATSRVIWEEAPVVMSIGEAMRNNKDGEGGVDQKVVLWLENFLRQNPDGVSFDLVQQEALRNGISKRTLYRAEKSVFVDKEFAGKNKPKIWRLIWDEGNDV